MDIRMLENGLNYLYYPMSNTHSVTLGLYIKTDINFDVSINSGIAHLLEHMHFRKIGFLSQEELYLFFEKTGSTLRAVTYRDFIKFSVKIIPQYLDAWIEIFSELINTYNWTDEELIKEKAVIRNQITEHNSFVSVDDIVRENVFLDTLYAEPIMGTNEEIENITVFDLIRYKKQIFSKKNVCFSVTGNISNQENKRIVDKLEKVIINTEQIIDRVSIPSNWHNRKPDICIFNTEDDGFFDVNISFDITYSESDVEYIRLLNGILGEGIGSRLEMLIREKLAMTSDIYSYIEWYKKIALLHIRFRVETEKIYNCIDVILNELVSIKNNISEKDIITNLPFFVTQRAFLEDSTDEMNFELSYNGFVLEMNNRFNSLVNNDKLNYDLHNLAKTIFCSQNMVVTVLGAEKEMKTYKIKSIIKKYFTIN